MERRQAITYRLREVSVFYENKDLWTPQLFKSERENERGRGKREKKGGGKDEKRERDSERKEEKGKHRKVGEEGWGKR